MIEWRDVSFCYVSPDGPATLHGVTLALDESELALVAGRTGSGKSTLLGTINGLVPRFTGGHLRGEVLIDGVSIIGRPPRELADLVGYVGQDPLAGFVTDTVEEELAYGMEQLGYAPRTMRRRVEETLDLLGIADLRRRPLRHLSGGQQQRVAIGSVLTTHPRVLVLDEPTSALDPTAAEEVLGILARLVDDVGLTVVLAEHRMERVIPFADRLVLVEAARVRSGVPADLLTDSPVAPPLIELGRLAGWRPLPLSVRGARKLRGTLDLPEPAPAAQASRASGPQTTRRELLTCDRVVVKHGNTVAVRHASIGVRSGEVAAVMGRNGSGKSSLLWTIQGAGRRESGHVLVDGTDPSQVSPQEARSLVGLVPQTAGDLLYLETVDQECAVADQQAGAAPGICRGLLDSLAPGVPGGSHPRDLSEGQRLSLALAIVLTAAPRVVLLDEPTRGLDYAAKAQLAAIVRRLAAGEAGDIDGGGRAVIIASHDVEFVAQVADSVVVLAGGEVVSAGAAAEVIAESPAFAPQVSKVLGPGWLTVAQVEKAMTAVVGGRA